MKMNSVRNTFYAIVTSLSITACNHGTQNSTHALSKIETKKPLKVLVDSAKIDTLKTIKGRTLKIGQYHNYRKAEEYIGNKLHKETMYYPGGGHTTKTFDEEGNCIFINNK